MKLAKAIPAALLLSAFLLSSCAHTVTGVATDVKDTGRAVKRAVD